MRKKAAGSCGGAGERGATAARGAALRRVARAKRVAVHSGHPGFRPDGARISRDAGEILDTEGYPPGSVSIAFVGDEEMARVNGEFRGKPRPTDVLSFDLGGGELPRAEGEIAGEVLVSVPRAREQARECGVTLGEEVARLVIHGLLHLSGYDHHRPGERRRMRAREAHWLEAAAGGRGWVRGGARAMATGGARR